jgi:5-methylcytosine-specific restriction endonuclease McrA
MESKEYSEKLKDGRWQMKRSQIIDRDGNRCQRCRAERDLEVHHIHYNGEPWEAYDEDLITLCECCHLSIHIKQEFRGINYSASDITFAKRKGTTETALMTN